MSISTKTTQKKVPSDKSVFRKQVNNKNSLNKQNSPAQEILNLHQSIGNQAVQRLFESGFIQGKLTVGEPNDKYEQEADRVADEVMRMPEPQVQRQSEEDEEEEMIQTKPVGEQVTPLVQRQVEPEEEEEETLQAKAEGQIPQVAPNLESRINALQGGGQSLLKETRNFFEPRFGQDFSAVKIHTDSNANQMARSINAKAFTKGKDVVFGAGEYKPESSSGKRLLGHELTHVVQQNYLRSKKTKEEINRKESLGYESWKVPGWGSHKSTVWVCTEEEWREILSDAGSSDVFYNYVKGFLDAAIYPSRVGRKTHPDKFPNYVNTLKRVPSPEERLAFMRALYGLGGGLEITPGFFGGGSYIWCFHGALQKFIKKYQKEYLLDVSSKGRKVLNGEPSRVVGQEEIYALAKQAGSSVRVAMIVNAISSAVEAVFSLVLAYEKSDEAKMSNAYSVIGNAGTLIRHSLDAHKAALKENEALKMLVFDFILDVTKLDNILAVQTLLRRMSNVKTLLISSAKDMIKEGASSKDPQMQGSKIAEVFENRIRSLGPTKGKLINTNVENGAITRFNSSMSHK